MGYSTDYRRAKKRVAKRRGFYMNLITYLAINFWFFVNFDFNFSLAFWWGLGLLFHYISVFGLPGGGMLSKDWEEREIQKEMNKMHRALPPTEQEPIDIPEPQKKNQWSDEDLV